MAKQGILKSVLIVLLVFVFSAASLTYPQASRYFLTFDGEVEGSPDQSLYHFNDDDIADLVIGIPDEDVTPSTNNGAFQVLFGSSPDGLGDGGDDAWGQMSDPSETGDAMGFSLATGDFDGDRYVDLAVGIPYENLPTTITNAGSVEVWYGAAAGLDSASAEFWNQASSGVLGGPEEGDLFGYSLAAADFDADGFVDLAIGVPYEDADVENDGLVHIFLGSADGVVGGLYGFQQDFYTFTEPAEVGDKFGQVLATGDFDGDGFADLAIGVPQENIEAGSYEDAGIVHIFYGSSLGLGLTGWQSFTQPTPADYEEFGSALTSGDFNGDNVDDLAIGIPQFNLPSLPYAGSVRILYGAASGLSNTGAQTFDRGVSAEVLGQYGFSLSAGDYDGDGDDDLAVGMPFEDVSGVTDAGSVEILIGASSGLFRPSPVQVWYQDRPDMEDTGETGDEFGYALASADFDHDGYDDLVAGVPFEDVYGAGNDEGAAQVMYGTSIGIMATNNWWFCQGLGSLEGTTDVSDHFGAVLAASVARMWLFLPVIRK